MMRRAGALLLVMVGLLLVLTYLLARAATPDAALHERTLDAFHALNLHDASLHRDVLRARAGILRNYDPLVRAVDSLRAATGALEAADQAIPGNPLAPHLPALVAEVDQQERLAETFKSTNALLQNSLTYFTHASRKLGLLAEGEPPGVAGEVAVLANAMLQFTGEPRPETSAAVEDALRRLDQAAAAAPLQQELRALVAHGRLIVATLPAVDEAVGRLLAARTAGQARTLQDVYLAHHARAEARARLFRILLYAASVLLLAYLGFVLVRLRANAQALRARLDLERTIAQISARFINLPRGAAEDAIHDGLARLAKQLRADRAAIVLPGTDGERRYAWPAEASSTPTVPAAARARLSIPMHGPGGPVGCLMLEAAHRARGWPGDDTALLRTAAEIFASALEREQAEGEKEALEARLRQAERMEAIGTLAGGIAHDFNNILGVILGHAEMALGKLPRAGNGARAHVRQVMTAAERARRIVDQILAFSRRARHEREPVRLADVLQEAVGLLRASLPASVTLRVEVADGTAVVVGDPARLQQLVMNLCTNAAQAMAGQGTVEVGLATVELPGPVALSHGRLKAGRYARLTVRDAGQGMDEATLGRIFEPFFTTKATGTGLGLASVHGIVAEHGGALDVRSRPGEGSSFAAYLACPKDFAAVAAASGEPAPLARGHGETVLLVDDEQPLVLLGEEMLAALGYEPVGYDSSPEALAAFRAAPGRFDALLADEVMPALTGTELAAAVHRIRPELPVILMTGHGGEAGRQRHLQAAGVKEVLRKPLLARDIAQSLARHLHPGG